MKIGILTWHSQRNYGGVLQCWALQSAFHEMGHEVVIIDRWIDPRNEHLRGNYNKLTFKQWVKFIVRGCLGCGDFGFLLRHIRTKKFLLKDLNLTQYHFFEWSEAPKNLGVDVVVVGSDQLWHCSNDFRSRHDVYLLEGAPRVPAISYAVSFGRNDIPSNFITEYHNSLKRFSAISVRERNVVSLIEKCGFTATHVCDPTILLPPEIWKRKWPLTKRSRFTVMLYLLSEKVKDIRLVLEEYAKDKDWDIRVYVDAAFNPSLDLIPRTVKGLVKRLYTNLVSRHGVRIVYDAGPAEFVKGIASADAVITDSFHGLMISSIYGKNIRMIRPNNDHRRMMFARIEEFVNTYTNGGVFVDSVKDALWSINSGNCVEYAQSSISEFRLRSRKWLECALGNL